MIGIGQRYYKVFTLVNSGTVISLPSFCDDGKYDCNFILPVYAYNGTDDLKNDKSGLYVLAQSWTTSITFVIQKKIGSTYVDMDTFDDNTYGEYYAQGDYTNKPAYSGIVIYWKEVLATFGVGEYRIKTTEINPLGTNVTYSKPFCLKQYVCTPDNTVRLEWWLNKGIGNIDNDKEILDYSDINAYYQIRLPVAIFGYPKSEYEEEEIQYTNGRLEDVKNIQSEKYILKIGAIPAWLHNVIKTMAFQSGTLLITDYSSNNPQEIIKKAVKRTSAYEPRYSPGSKCAPITVELKPQYSRLEKFGCL
jgi:hypothetical protein